MCQFSLRGSEGGRSVGTLFGRERGWVGRVILVAAGGGVIGGNGAIGGLYLVLVLGIGEGWRKRGGGVMEGNVADRGVKLCR